MKIAFVTNYCRFDRVKTYEYMAKLYNIKYYFFSKGDEWYWDKRQGIYTGNFQHEYLPGFKIGRTWISPTLPLKLLCKNFSVYIKCVNGRFAFPLTYLIARLKRKPFILWTEVWTRTHTPFHRYTYPLVHHIYRHADAVAAYGEHVKQYWVKAGVPEERIFLTRPAVDNALFSRPVSEEEKTDLRQKLHILPDQKIILYVGRLAEVKGLSYLFEALAELQDTRVVLVIAGDGEEKPRLERLATELGIQGRVRYAGHVTHEQIVSYYALAWLLVLPSVTTPLIKETWGLVVNEAFNQGVPVLATDAVGAAAGGLVQDGVTGLVVAERNAAALKQALDRILDDPDMRGRMSENARRIIATWDNKQMVQGFQDAIRYVMKER